jgi:hypothetical protein
VSATQLSINIIEVAYLTGLDASYEVMVAHDGGLELVSLASTVVDLETDLRGGRRESEARN